MIDDEETLLAFDEGETRHLKTVKNQIATFEYCLKTAPEVAGEMMRAVLRGSDSTVQHLITAYSLTAQDILQMRGLDFIVPLDIQDPKLGNSDIRLTVDAYNWNPLHYATAYKRFKVLNLFKKKFETKLDLLWAMSLPCEDDYEGVALEQRRFKHGISQFLDAENAHLYGFILVLATKSVELLEFFFGNQTTNGNVTLKELQFLIDVCRRLKWGDGVVSLVNSVFVKNLYVQAALEDKLSLLNKLLSFDFVRAFVHEQFGLDSLHSNGFIKQVKQAVYNFPYVAVCWLQVDPLLESDFDYKRYINTMKLNFTPRCVEMLDSVNQVHDILKLCKEQREQMQRDHQNQRQEVENQIPKIQNTKEDGW